MNSELATTTEIEVIHEDVCDLNATFKAYEDYKLITDTSSPAYQYIVNHMVVGADGLLRNENGSIGIALSSRYGDVGTEYLISFSSGITERFVIIDRKQEAHLTNNCTDGSGGMMEVVCDTNLIDSSIKTAGSFDLLWSGTIVSIERLN